MKLLYISLISFIFIATSALALSGQPVLSPINLSSYGQKDLSFLPTLTGQTPFPVLSAEAALAVDTDSGVSLYEKNADTPLYPASTTKIITALVAMDYYPPDMELTVPKVNVDGQKMGLVLGEKIKAEDVLNGLLVYSANDAAEALAQNFPGGRDLFIAAMNIKARQLSLDHSNFKNPSGLDGNTQVTTARDLVRVSEVAMKNPRFAKIVATKEITVKSEDGKIVHKMVNINKLLGEVPGVMGVKTGWTENARENLVTFIERDGHKVMIAILGSSDRFGETKELIDWIFSNYTWSQVVPTLHNNQG